MAKYNSWDEFVSSGDPLLQCKPVNFYMEKGVMNFHIEHNGVRYFCTGSDCCASNMYFDPNSALKTQCDFDNFWMFESGNESNEICNW